MEELMSVNYLDLFAIPELSNKNFFIPDYQRGYRWGEVQVRQLLEDLYSFFYNEKASGSFYCLQPVVVKKLSSEKVSSLQLNSKDDNNVWYEVIDGQQRLTTIRIILALEKLMHIFSKNSFLFNIHYETRPDLCSFLDDIIIEQNDSISAVYGSHKPTDIDSWHILRAANQILSWFQEGGRTMEEFAGGFYENFTNTKEKNKSVQVIWYELRDGSDPYDIFKRLNYKSISLNNAELIRGMFLSDSARYKCDEQFLNQFNDDARDIVENREQARKQSHIIEQWDVIESQLRNENFWAFIKQTKGSEAYSCRIEYIFDLISQKSNEQRDALYTYLEFDRMLKIGKVNDLWDLWLMVETYFSLLMAWYKEPYYYHKIGYLTTVLGKKTLTELLLQSSTCSKTQFKESIDSRICESIHDNNKSRKRILDYNYNDDYTLLKRVLFLYNVESTYQQGLSFFPFDQYKEKEWTLEHIHAQNSEKIDHSLKEKWQEWFEENHKALERLHNRLREDSDLTQLYDYFNKEFSRFLHNKDKYTFNDFNQVFDRVLGYFNELSKQEGTPTVIHGISNMALLDGEINTSIGNSVFEVKRQMIMDADANGKYIPVCTRKVFLKYFNKDDQNFTVQQNFYWSENDRKHYEEDIKRVLKQYIDKESPKQVETN